MAAGEAEGHRRTAVRDWVKMDRNQMWFPMISFVRCQNAQENLVGISLDAPGPQSQHRAWSISKSAIRGATVSKVPAVEAWLETRDSPGYRPGIPGTLTLSRFFLVKWPWEQKKQQKIKYISWKDAQTSSGTRKLLQRRLHHKFDDWKTMANSNSSNENTNLSNRSPSQSGSTADFIPLFMPLYLGILSRSGFVRVWAKQGLCVCVPRCFLKRYLNLVKRFTQFRVSSICLFSKCSQNKHNLSKICGFFKFPCAVRSLSRMTITSSPERKVRSGFTTRLHPYSPP